MPVIAPSTYRPPLGFRSGHLQTIIPTLFRRVPAVTTRRERIDTPDGDFLDLDWSPRSMGNKRLAVLSHGLEATSSQAYIQGMAAALQRRGWDILAWNFRGCSGEPNRLARSYHSGSTEDLNTVLDHAFELGRHRQIALVGFSLGGNLTLKYLGDLGSDTDPRLCGSATFSVPCDLASSAEKMALFAQRIYMRRFLKCLRLKIRQKIEAHPNDVSDLGLDQMRIFREFDDKYTAPLHGFASVDDYWRRCSCKPVLPEIRLPSLMVNAADDPFLGTGCFPHEEAKTSDHFFFESPRAGGHMGFVQRNPKGEYWSESRAAEFLDKLVG